MKIEKQESKNALLSKHFSFTEHSLPWFEF